MKPLLLLLLCLPLSLRAVTQAEFTSVVAVFKEEFQRDAAQRGFVLLPLRSRATLPHPAACLIRN